MTGLTRDKDVCGDCPFLLDTVMVFRSQPRLYSASTSPQLRAARSCNNCRTDKTIARGKASKIRHGAGLSKQEGARRSQWWSSLPVKTFGLHDRGDLVAYGSPVWQERVNA